MAAREWTTRPSRRLGLTSWTCREGGTWVQRLLHLPQELEGSAASRQDVRCRKFVSSVEVSFLYISLYVQIGSFLFQTILLQYESNIGLFSLVSF